MERIQVKFRAPKYRFDLKAAILKRGYKTQKDFAEVVNVHPGVMSQIFNGTLIPDFKIQAKIADVLGLSPQQLYRLLK